MRSELAAALRDEARAANERRLLVLAGARDAGDAAAAAALDAAGIDRARTVLVSRREFLECERLAPDRAGELLGRTREAVVLDCHDACRPNALGQSVGAVDGGGLLLLLAPPLDAWPDRRDAFDERLAVPPYTVEDVSGNFRQRLVGTLRAHRGVAVVDLDRGEIARDGLVGGGPSPHVDPSRASEERSPAGADAEPAETVDLPRPRSGRTFPPGAYEACLTADQVHAVESLERLREAGHAVVVEADRGRGKSSAAGIAAGALAAEGRDVLVTAPGYRNAREVFVRAAALLDRLDAPARTEGEPPRRIKAEGGGRVRFAGATTAADLPNEPDVVVVDEAAALPVHLLAELLSAPSAAFATTVHGYEGAGRGFAVRFRDRLDDADHEVREVRLRTPIRYAAGDPVEAWAFRALLLDARPAVDQVVADVSPEDTRYVRPTPTDLLADEPWLREAFGLLVLAHYRTEPDDLARLLDAPNLAVRALVEGGHVVAVALLAEEGGLPAPTRRRMYAGERVRGNMVPDLLAAQLRDEAAAELDGVRVVRIATHPAVRRRGLGSRLLDAVGGEFDDVDWLGAGFGATPDLLRFWLDCGYGVVHLGTTRNETSGEYSALVLRPTSDAGRRLHDRHAGRFAGRAAAMLSDPLRDADPDVVRAALDAVEAPVALDLADHEWRLVAAAGAGPAHLETDPGPFRRLTVKHLVDPAAPDVLTPREERLLVARVLQARPAAEVAAAFEFPSERQAMRALGRAVAALVERYGPDPARSELDRHE